jgi:hypothetical protein
MSVIKAIIHSKSIINKINNILDAIIFIKKSIIEGTPLSYIKNLAKPDGLGLTSDY